MNLCYYGENYMVWDDSKFTGDRKFIRDIWYLPANETEIVETICEYSGEYKIRPKDTRVLKELIDGWDYSGKERYYLLCRLLEEDPKSSIFLSY